MERSIFFYIISLQITIEICNYLVNTLIGHASLSARASHEHVANVITVSPSTQISVIMT